MTIGITGATGYIGSTTARFLLPANAGLVLLARDPSRIPADLAGVEARRIAYANTPEVREALAGVDTLLMVSAKESPERVADHCAFVDAAAEAGVKHIVYTSFIGASPTATFTHARDHYATEEHIKASGMDWTFLRDSFYIEFFVSLIDAGEVRGPAGDGKCAPVTRRDVAACAAAALLNPSEDAGVTYNLTGPELLTMADVVRIASAVRGSDIPYIDETLDEAQASRATYGAPQWEVEAWISTYTAIKAGELNVRTDHVERMTGRRPRTLEQFLLKPR